VVYIFLTLKRVSAGVDTIVNIHQSIRVQAHSTHTKQISTADNGMRNLGFLIMSTSEKGLYTHSATYLYLTDTDKLAYRRFDENPVELFIISNPSSFKTVKEEAE